MAFWDDAKNKMMQAIRPRQQEDNQVISNRADGGFSGYVPKMNRPQQDVQATGYQQARPAGMENMMPTGVDPSVMQHFQPVGGQTGQMPPQGAQPPQGMPMQGQPQQGMPRPQAQFQPQQPQPTRPGFGQPAFQQNAPQQGYTGKFQQQPPMVQPQPMGAAQSMGAAQPMGGPQPMQQGFTGKQPFPPQMPPQGVAPQQPMAQAQPVQNDGHTFVFPGESYVVDGNAYKLVFRVAQITGVPSCFRVIEFMYNNEAVIVNAEQITDLVEADRCMDLIFGAACAMKQRLMRVSGKQIYLITPPQVYVAPFEPLRRAGMADIERRWPGALQANMQPQQVNAQPQPFVNNVQPMNRQPMQMPMNQAMPFNQGMPMGQAVPDNRPTAQQAPFGQARQDDFAGGFGRRAARNAMHTNGYTDYGGFGMKTR